MDILNLFKEFAKKIQKDELLIEHIKAQKQMNEDLTLQKQINDFNNKKADLNFELSKKDREENKISSLNSELKSIYETIMQNKNMKIFNVSKEKIDKLIKDINFILVETINGADPETINLDAQCKGNCGGCSGCH